LSSATGTTTRTSVLDATTFSAGRDMDNSDNRRRKYFINRHYQGRFMAAFIGASVIGVAMTALATVRFVSLGIDAKLFSSHFNISNTTDIVLPVAVKVNLIFFILCVIMIGLLGVYYSRKADRLASGMLEWLEEFGKGRLDAEAVIGLEHEFPNLDDSLNGMAASARKRALEIRKLAQEIDEAIARLETTGPGQGDIRELKDSISTLQDKLDSIST